MSAYRAIASQTLTSSASSVTFSSIPGTFRDLVLVCLAGTSTNAFAVPRIRINSDTGTNYPFVRMSGNGSSATSGFGTDPYISVQPIGNMTTALDTQFIVQFMDYSVTDKHKSVLIRTDRAADGTSAQASRWANTSAVTALEIFPAGANWQVGSTFSLYGISA